MCTFNGSNGAYPYAGLIEDSHGNLFGTTGTGGAYGSGTIFEIPNATHTIITLYSFAPDSTSGYHPFGGLTMDEEGNLFGTTWDGGTLHQGTVFELSYNVSSQTYDAMITLASFDIMTTGRYPWVLTRDIDGNLVGATTQGGPANAGVVFELRK